MAILQDYIIFFCSIVACVKIMHDSEAMKEFLKASEVIYCMKLTEGFVTLQCQWHRSVC